MGSTHYGHLSAVLSAPVTLATALAPWIGAGLADALGGYSPMFLFMAVLAVLATALGSASLPSRQISAVRAPT